MLILSHYSFLFLVSNCEPTKETSGCFDFPGVHVLFREHDRIVFVFQLFSLSVLTDRLF